MTNSQDLRPIDADNHYYEPLDAFTRHLDPAFRTRAVQAVQWGNRTLLLMGGKVNLFIPNPTFDPVAKPGCMDLYFRGQIPDGESRASLMEVEPLPREYMDRDVRLARMDEQGLRGALMLPTVAVGAEEALKNDVPATMAALHAFNRWLEDDWGYAYQNRLFGGPLISLADPDAAVIEVERVLGLGAKVVLVRPAPVPSPTGTRSLGDPLHDPVWARLAEAGVPVVFHLSDSGYNALAAMWGAASVLEAFKPNVLAKVLTQDRAIYDSMASMIVNGVLTRHPDLRLMSIENGAAWVAPLLRALKKSRNQFPEAFGGDPVEQFKQQVWVAPYFEEDIEEVVDLIGAERVLFGSDWPHAEGLVEPLMFEKEIAFAGQEARDLIMRDNILGLLRLS